MVVKNKLARIVKIREILKKQHGTLFTSDLKIFNIPRIYLTILEQNGEIERVSRGIYRLVASIDDEMFNFQVRFKSSIYSHETALYLHDLMDRTQLSYSISVPVGYHQFH
jgi:predicted transcriptional regulator of viral defense system